MSYGLFFRLMKRNSGLQRTILADSFSFGNVWEVKRIDSLIRGFSERLCRRLPGGP